MFPYRQLIMQIEKTHMHTTLMQRKKKLASYSSMRESRKQPQAVTNSCFPLLLFGHKTTIVKIRHNCKHTLRPTAFDALRRKGIFIPIIFLHIQHQVSPTAYSLSISNSLLKCVSAYQCDLKNIFIQSLDIVNVMASVS